MSNIQSGAADVLTPAEYGVLVGGDAAPVDFLAETKAWDKANIGTNGAYSEQLFSRLQFYCNAWKADFHRAELKTSIVALQLAIYRTEQISGGMGVGKPDRQVPFNKLVQGEGVYTTAPDDLQELLMSAQPADAWMADASGVLVGGPHNKTAQEKLRP